MVFKDFSFLNFLKWVRVTLVYLKIFLSGLRKTSLREDYFCCGLGVSTFQTGRWGFSYRAGNSFSLLPSTLPNLRQALQSLPPAALRLCGHCSFVLPSFVFKRKVTTPWLTSRWQGCLPQHSLPVGTCFCPLSSDKEGLPITEISSLSFLYLFFLWRGNSCCFACLLLTVCRAETRPPPHYAGYFPFPEMQVVFSPSERCVISLPWF